MAGKNAFGTTLSRTDGTTGFDAIGSITSVSGPSFSRDTDDVTAHDSPDAYREFIGTLINGGEVSCDLNLDFGATIGSDNIVTVLMGDLQDSDPVAYEIAFPSGAKFAADLLITRFEPSSPHDGRHTARLSFQVSGKPTFTPA